MPEQKTVYKLLISRPGDVEQFDEQIKMGIDRFNSIYGNSNHLEVEPIDWIEDSFPILEFGKTGQDILNSQIVYPCDMCLSFLWTKFGTPTSNYESGTEEEIMTMLNEGRPVFLYFLNISQALTNIDPEQYRKVLNFRDKLNGKRMGLYKIINKENDIQDEVTKTLTSYFDMHKIDIEQVENISSLNTELEKATTEIANLKSEKEILSQENEESKKTLEALKKREKDRTNQEIQYKKRIEELESQVLKAEENGKSDHEKIDKIKKILQGEVKSVKTIQCKKGDIIKFGTYPQTKQGDDNTPIEWQVLDVDYDKREALLISRYGLDAQPYNKEYVDVTWDTCTLRTWLNNDFLNTAFAENKRNVIADTEVDNSKAQGKPSWNTDGGKNKTDKVFLLSYAEAKTYFAGDDARMCVPTDYAIQQGAYINKDYKVDGKATCVWWLRSPWSSSFAAGEHIYGALSDFGSVSDDGVSVRPALRVNLDSGIF